MRTCGFVVVEVMWSLPVVCVLDTTVNPIKWMNHGVWEQTRVAPTSCILNGSTYWRHLANAMDRSLRRQ